MSDDSTTEDDAGGADYRQVSFVALAALALVLAAAFAPGMSGGGDGSSPGFDVDFDWGGDSSDVETDGGSGGGDSGDRPDGGFDWRKLLEWLDIDGGDDGEQRTETEGEPQCVIVLDREPVPGGQLTVSIRYRGEPLADTPVWFDDRRVGETDEAGRVTGEVPYVEELVIRAGAASDATCRAGTATSSAAASGTASRQSADASRQPSETAPLATATSSAGPGAPPAAAAMPAGVSPASSARATATASSTASAASTQEGASANATGTYEIDGEVELDVRGDPYPGETVTVDAAIEGEPMREATVSVDGTAVGETDADGRAAVTVPDDGTDAFELEVARGDFAGATTVDVLLLEAAFVPDGLAPVPGSPGAVEATIDGEPVADAEVTVDGEYYGRTGDDGRLAVGLPRDPTATVTVSTERQAASASLADQYGTAALLIALVAAGLAALSSRRYGRRGPLAVVGAAVTVATVLVTEAFYGPRGGLAALGVVGLLGLGVVWVRSDGDWSGPGVRDLPSVRDRLDRLGSRLVALALRSVERLEALLDRFHSLAAAVRAWLRTLPRSGRECWTRFASWLGTLPKRGRARLGNALAAARALPFRAIAAGLGALPLIAGGVYVDGVRGGVVVTVALAVAGAVAVRSGEDEAESTASDDAGERTDAESTVEATRSADETLTFRELWRAFARRVAPGRWRTRTPGEIERRALSDGYPREPVRELTTLFREVEYGGRSRSRRRRERAAEAYDAVERAREREETAESDAGDDGDAASATESTREPTADTGDDP